MDFLERLDYLKQIHGESNATLSKATGIPYSTIDSFYKKGYWNVKLSTLRTICAHYHVTLDFMVGNDMEEDMTRQKLLSIYDELTAEGKQMLLAQAEFFRGREQTSKKESESVG